MRLAQRLRFLAAMLATPTPGDDPLTPSQDLRLAASSNLPVLITAGGDADVELARSIHAQSRGASASLVIVRCGGDDANVLETGVDLSGAARLAAGGTLLVRGVDQLGVAGQCQLAALACGAEDRPGARTPAAPRLIVSTAGCLYERTVTGEFDEDLFYHLNVLHIRMPIEPDFQLDELPSERGDAEVPIVRQRLLLDLPEVFAGPAGAPMVPVTAHILDAPAAAAVAADVADRLDADTLRSATRASLLHLVPAGPLESPRQGSEHAAAVPRIGGARLHARRSLRVALHATVAGWRDRLTRAVYRWMHSPAHSRRIAHR